MERAGASSTTTTEGVQSVHTIDEDRIINNCMEKLKDPHAFRCNACEVNLILRSESKVTAHIASRRHQTGAAELASGIRKKKKGPYSHKFSAAWTTDSRYKSWIRCVPEDCYKFQCIICDVIRNCRGGISSLDRHASRDKHKAQCSANSIAKADEIPAEVVQDSIGSFKDSVRIAELDYVRLGGELSIPYAHLNPILNFFKGLDPAVLQKMTAGASKVSGIARNVLGRYEEDSLIQMLRNVKFAILIVEGTQNDESWLTFLVRYVDPETLDVVAPLPKLLDLNATKLTAPGIFKPFKDYMVKHAIPFSNVIAMACDHASVMNAEKASFGASLRKENPSAIVITCVCHALALISKHSCEKTIPDVVEESMTSIVDHQNYAKRSQILAEFVDACQGLDLKLVKYSKTRWLGRHDAIKKLRLLMPSLQACFSEAIIEQGSSKKLEKLERLNAFLNDLEMHAYLAFLEYVLAKFNDVNLFFQHSETRVHLLQEKCLQFLSRIARHFIQKSLLPHVQSGLVQYEESCNQLPLDEVSLGEECHDVIEKLASNNDGECDETVRRIRQNCLNFYVEAANQIQRRLFYINDEFFTSLVVFGSESALKDEDRDCTFKQVWTVAEKFGGFDEAAMRKEWRFLFSEYKNGSIRQEIDVLSFDDMWKEILLSGHNSGDFKYPQLKALLALIRSLPHSNAPAERIFSALTDVASRKKRSRLSSDSASAPVAIKRRKETGRASEVTEKQLAQTSSASLHEPPNVKQRSLTLYASDEEMPQE